MDNFTRYEYFPLLHLLPMKYHDRCEYRGPLNCACIIRTGEASDDYVYSAK